MSGFFTFTKQTSHVLVNSLRETSRLIRDLLTGSRYQFFLPSRFQSDHIERHFSKCRQMRRVYAPLNLREVNISEQNLILTSVLKERCLFT